METPRRRFDIDWLRVLAVLLPVPFHAALIFTPWDGSHIEMRSGVFSEVFITLVEWWHMSLLFLNP